MFEMWAVQSWWTSLDGLAGVGNFGAVFQLNFQTPNEIFTKKDSQKFESKYNSFKTLQN